jgi:hypothetical protein
MTWFTARSVANPALNWIRRHMKISPTFDGE